jgi:flagellar basal-body rod protein FlgG
MDRSLFTAATGMKAQQTNMDVISNNLANINTTGYKKSQAHFSTLFTQVITKPGGLLASGQISPSGVQVGLGVQLDATNKAFTMGSLTNTGNPLDVAIEGEGFFQIQLPNGQFAYTRDGNFQLDGRTGDIVTNRGYLVYPYVNLGADADKITISDDGAINVSRNSGSGVQTDRVGEFRLVRFANPAGLMELSDNLYLATDASGRPIDGEPMQDNLGAIRQGFLEGSNVKVVEEIVNMITAQRAYESSSNVIKAASEMLRQANNIVS